MLFRKLFFSSKYTVSILDFVNFSVHTGLLFYFFLFFFFFLSSSFINLLVKTLVARW